MLKISRLRIRRNESSLCLNHFQRMKWFLTNLEGTFWRWSKVFLRSFRTVIEQGHQFSVLQGFWTFFMWTVDTIDITLFEAMEPIMHVFTLLISSLWTCCCFQCDPAAVFFDWMKKVNISRKWRLFDTKSDISAQPKVHDGIRKSLICQGGLFTTYLSLVHYALVMSQSTTTYYWNHLFKNSGNLVAHLIL